MRATPILVLFACLLPGFALAQENIELPDFGDSAGAFISPEQERRLGAEFMRELRREAPLIEDVEVEDYLRELGRRVAEPSGYPGEVTFFMINNPQINAFAAPGGYIGVHSGLVLSARSESEVASVLAHEMVHLTQRHTVRAIEAQGRAAIPALIGMLGALAIAVANPEAGQAAMAGVQAAQAQYAINFTRANEQEADRIGIQLLYEAGFNPRAMPAFFDRMQIANRYNDPKHIPEYLRTHPVTINRIAEAQDRAARMPVVPDESSIEFHLVSARLRVLTANSPLQARQYYEAILRNRDYEDEEIARYGHALALTAVGDYRQAAAVLTDLIGTDPNRVAYVLAAADVSQRAGEAEEAVALYEQARLLDPDSRAALYGHTTALMRAGRALEARGVLRDRGFRDDEDPQYFRLLAEAEGQLGNEGDSRLAMAEHYFRQGEYQLAMRELDLAQRLPALTNYQTQRIRARQMEINQTLSLYQDERRRRR